MRYRLSLIRFAEKHGVTKAAIKYKTNHQYIYRWKRRYDGTIESLRDRSRRPYHHPNQHIPEEIKLIQDMRRRNPHAGLVVFWVKLMQRGYKRSIPGLDRFLEKQGVLTQKLPNPKYIPKPKVERSHRKDNKRFYASHTFYSFEDFSIQLQIYNRRDYNQFPMRPLGWKSPQTVSKKFIA